MGRRAPQRLRNGDLACDPGKNLVGGIGNLPPIKKEIDLGDGAKAASLTIMVGGPEKAFNTMKPLFEKMGKNVTLVGGNGDGQTTKVANQIIVALTIEAVGEALLFASK